MGISMKFGMNTTLVVLEMVNFQYNTHGTVFIPNFTATHAITSTNIMNFLIIDNNSKSPQTIV